MSTSGSPIDILSATPQADTQEYRIFGPPGCAKTTTLSRQIAIAAQKYGPNKVVACSFTRAAAAELGGRNLPLPKQNIGTIHSLCYRALDNPKIADEHIAEFNATVPHQWKLNVSTGRVDLEDRPTTQGLSEADRYFSEIQVWRNRFVPEAKWHTPHRLFYKHWCTWKQANGYLDYTDLLERGLHDIRLLPGEPNVLVVDEGQDLTPLQLAVVRQWARYVDYLLFALDEDQQIYGFTGCTPEAILQPDVPPEHKRFLKQSYRVPRAVHRYAVEHIAEVKVREQKEYLPRDADGEVRSCRGTYLTPRLILDDVERVVAGGHTAMILAPCSYQLSEIRLGLIQRGLPFHNPYRRVRGDWNPLTPSKGTSTVERVLAFLRPRVDVWGDDARPWTGEDLKSWTELISATETLVRGAKRLIDGLMNDAAVTMRMLDEFFLPAALDGLVEALTAESLAPSLEWIERRLVKAKKPTADFSLRVLRAHGPAGVAETPKVVLGTIHSVKGGQADAVYLIPDISTQASGLSDEVRRQFYVGITRAKESLVICQRASQYVARLKPVPPPAVASQGAA